LRAIELPPATGENHVSLTDLHVTLPMPPDALSFGDVSLRLECVAPGDPSRDFVPYYHFRILTADGTDVGHINFRVGDTEHVRFFAGHIGFAVLEKHRGNGYALQACQAIAPLVRSIYERAIITCDPDNAASIRTIEKLGATFIDVVPTPLPALDFQPRANSKRRYAWTP
jgi:tagatose 1,6-diphosphate aldolase